ncbi:MAG: zinc dependent phospholipase C family protein [Acidobacteriota bacterium]|nr:zinc dependent phospholipase C family protein [Acidobacteriota bacterium]
MRIAVTAVIGLVVLGLSSGSPAAWGFDVHRFITNAAMDHVPGAIRPFYQKHRAFITEHSIDPDLMRTYGIETEEPNHFLDMDGVAPDPFTGIPREEADYITLLGKEKAHELGRVPWRVEEVYNRLVAEFERPAKGQTISANNITALSAILSHYVEDAHVPFHAVLNYDGQSTNQRGIHGRFESELFRRFQARMTIAPLVPEPVMQPRDFIFAKLIEGSRLVPAILAADKTATKGREFYDDAYFEAFYGGAKPIVERRINEAIGGVAAVITGAWKKAGSPVLPLDDARGPARIRR